MKLVYDASVILLLLTLPHLILQAAPVASEQKRDQPQILNSVGDACGRFISADNDSPNDPICNPVNLTCLLAKLPDIRPISRVKGGFTHRGRGNIFPGRRDSDPQGRLGIIRGHGPVLPPSDDQDHSGNSDGSTGSNLLWGDQDYKDVNDVVAAESTRLGQCVIKHGKLGEACGTFVQPSVVCEPNLVCAFDLKYPPQNAEYVDYQEDKQTAEIGTEMVSPSAIIEVQVGDSGEVMSPGVKGACVPVVEAVGGSCFGARKYPPHCSEGLECSVGISSLTEGVCVNVTAST
ncbi:hypothetical protein BJ741DRAFT_603250 [Chytriomyces cf. hyalinus JEL632]|nr:hypothetical protein BJ741DRAFT_603250 [Chytriomyces cf. hyalinus JEL632]